MIFKASSLDIFKSLVGLINLAFFKSEVRPGFHYWLYGYAWLPETNLVRLLNFFLF